MTRKYQIQLSVTLEVDQAVCDQVLTDEWRAKFYDLNYPIDVAAHVIYSLVQGIPLTSLEGFANLDPKLVKLGRISVDQVCDVTPVAAKRGRR